MGKIERGHPPIAPSSAKHAKLLLERSTAVPIKRFDSADYFLSQYIDRQKAEAARVSARRIQSLDSHLSQPGSPPQHTSARFAVLGLVEAEQHQSRGDAAQRDESMTWDMHGPRTCLAIERRTANGCDVMFTESSIHSWSSYVDYS